MGIKPVDGTKVKLALFVGQGENEIMVAGQDGASLNLDIETKSLDIKDVEEWVLNSLGKMSFSVDCSGLVIFGDNAYDLIEENILLREEFKAKFVLPSGKAYEGQVVCNSLALDFPNNDNMTYSLSFTGTGALKITKATQEGKLIRK